MAVRSALLRSEASCPPARTQRSGADRHRVRQSFHRLLAAYFNTTSTQLLQ
jgi:hypothetical protein